jgi:shikimate dehydrogenase
VSDPRAFVIGHPIGHSRSPLIHRTWLERYGLVGSYDPVDVAPEALPSFLERVRAGEFVGGNVTIPHKEAVAALCDEVDATATRIGAVNTLVVRNGRVIGRNTDHLGFLANLDDKAPGWDADSGRAIVLGAGGAARAVLVALAARGFGEIAVLNRTAERAVDLAAEFGAPVSGHGLAAFGALAPGASVVVNTSSVGMHGTRFDGLALERLPQAALVTDIVYVPLVTPLLAEAAALGLATVDGLGMLLHQAAPGFAAWFGIMPEVDAALRRTVEATL